jgi:orotidine-5'-phosphate decarboxylase
MKKLIFEPRTIIPACDVEIDKFEELIEVTTDIDKVGGYKIGFSLALKYGLPKVVESARKYTQKPLIYDHQKGATDIPDIGENFAKVVSESGINSVILFPQAGPVTLRAWVKASENAGLNVIVGGYMTHDAYTVSDGGFITVEGVERIYKEAAILGVTDFVVPGNQPEIIRKIKKILEDENISPIFYVPGFIAQSGKLSDASMAVGPHWHAIVGRAIYNSHNMRRAALNLLADM